MTTLIITITAVLFSIFLGLRAVIRNYKSPLNIFFFFIVLSSSAWLSFSTLADYFDDANKALLFTRLAMTGGPIFFAFTYLFSLVFPERKNISIKKTFLVLLPNLIIYPFILTKHNVKSVSLEDWGTNYEPGILYIYILALVSVYLVLSLKNLIKKYKNSKGLFKEQIKYVIFALCFSSLIGVTSNGILPLFFEYTKLSAIGPSITVILINSFFAYTILKYRLLDIKIIIQESIIYISTAFFLLLLCWSLIYILEDLTSLDIRSISILSSLISSLITISSLKYINFTIKQITSPMLFKNSYNFSEITYELNQALGDNVELEKMLDQSFKILMEALKIEKITFLLYDKELGKFVSKKSLGFSSDVKLEINKDNALYRYLDKFKEPVISEEVEMKLNDNLLNKEEEKIAQKTVAQFKKWGLCICQPIIKSKKIIGIVCVGEKKNGNLFHEEDLQLITNFANQIVLVIENFLAFNEIKIKKEQLEKNMGLMVGRELKMMELKKKIKELES